MGRNGQNSSGEGHSEFIEDESDNISTLPKKIEEELRKDPLTKGVELPITPSEGKEFTPSKSQKKVNVFRKIGKKISGVTKWQVMLTTLQAVFTGGAGWLVVLAAARAVDYTQYIISGILTLIGLGGWLLTVWLKRREEQQLVELETTRQELRQDQEIHKQELTFKKAVFDNDLEITKRRAMYQEEIDRNQNIEVMGHFIEIVKQKPATQAEIPLHIEQLKVAEKVLETLILDRILKHGQFEHYQTNVLVKEIRELKNSLVVLVDLLSGQTASARERPITGAQYEEKMLNVLDRIERMEMSAESNKIKSEVLLMPNVGIIEMDKDHIISKVNEFQAMYSGTGIYNYIGKPLIDFIEIEYPTDQRNVMLEILQDVYLGKFKIIPFKHMITSAGQMVDLTLHAFPNFDSNLEFIGMTVITTHFTLERCTDQVIEFPTDEKCLDCSEILILLANPSDEMIRKQEQIMKHMKYNLHKANSIAEAEIILAKEGIDLIIMDLYFEDGSAQDFCVKLHGLYPFLKVIMYTSTTNNTMKKNLLQLPNVFAYHEINGKILDFVQSLQNATIKILDERTSAERTKGEILNGELNKLVAPQPKPVEKEESRVNLKRG